MTLCLCSFSLSNPQTLCHAQLAQLLRDPTVGSLRLAGQLRRQQPPIKPSSMDAELLQAICVRVTLVRGAAPFPWPEVVVVVVVVAGWVIHACIA